MLKWIFIADCEFLGLPLFIINPLQGYKWIYEVLALQINLRLLFLQYKSILVMTQNPHNHRHIFLVDDDQEDREMFSEALSHINDGSVRFTEISSAAKLIETLNNPATPMPELIFMDINMPKINGLECLKKLKSGSSKFNGLNVVMYSTYSNREDIDEAYKQGAGRYYVKPTLFDNLKELISGALHANWNTIDKQGFFVSYAR